MCKKYTFFLLLMVIFFLVSFSGVSVKSVKQEDGLELQIRFLKSLKQSGKKLGLVIGRTNIEQNVFSSRGEDIIWNYEKLPCREDVVQETTSKLNFDSSNLENIKRLENLFYVVVIDRFSWNFLQDEPVDFMTHYSKLLEKNPESCIFFEAVPTMVFVNKGNEDNVRYNSYSYKVPSSWLSCAQSDGARIFDSRRLTLEKNMLLITQNHLMGWFGSVAIKDLIVHDLLQTQENEPEENEPVNQINSKLFFVLKQPVSAQNEL